MKVNLSEIIPSYCGVEELKYFNQFNVYETVCYKDKIEANKISFNNVYNYTEIYNNDLRNGYKKYCCNKISELNKVEYTCPNIAIISTKIVNTMEGISLEGQCLTGKKLVIIGKIEISLILTYRCIDDTEYKCIKEVSIPFSIFIIIPQDSCNIDIVNLRYSIEDISVEDLLDGKLLVSITILIQYIEEVLTKR